MQSSHTLMAPLQLGPAQCSHILIPAAVSSEVKEKCSLFLIPTNPVFAIRQAGQRYQPVPVIYSLPGIVIHKQKPFSTGEPAPMPPA